MARCFKIITIGQIFEFYYSTTYKMQRDSNTDRSPDSEVFIPETSTVLNVSC
jgi:ABC-type polysaccharide transport system permease subunit